MKLLALILASGLATSLVGCATDSGSQPTQEDLLLGTWMGNFHTKATLFTFDVGNQVIEHDEATNAEKLGTFALVDGTLTLDFDGTEDFRVVVTDTEVSFVDSHETLSRLSACGGPSS
ncbi:MAG TPA: hypothetical protein VGM39_17615, partial [Kofleriaceae bacterium]